MRCILKSPSHVLEVGLKFGFEFFFKPKKEDNVNSYIIYMHVITLLRKIHLFYFLRFERSFCFDFIVYYFLLFVLSSFPYGL